MSRKLKKYFSILLVLVFSINMLVYSYAEGSNMRSVRIVDEMNNSYDS